MKLMICANLDVGGLPAIDLASGKIAKWQEDKIEALAAALGDAKEKCVDACVIAGGLFAKGFVAVDVRTDTFLAVVKVYGFKIFGSNLLVKLVESEFVAKFVGYVVACCKGVASVDTYAYAVFVVDAADDACYLCEGVAEIGALSCGVFYHGGYALRLTECEIDFLRNLVETRLGTYLSEVRARVEIEHGEPQLLASCHLVEESGTRFQ